jgi:hypothetical protein
MSISFIALTLLGIITTFCYKKAYPDRVIRIRLLNLNIFIQLIMHVLLFVYLSNKGMMSFKL